MRGERILFYLTLVFIGGHLASGALLQGSNPTIQSTICAASILLIIILIPIAIADKGRHLSIFIPIFLLMGILNYGRRCLLGDYNFLDLASGSDWIGELRNTFALHLEGIIPPGESAAGSLLKALTMGEKRGIPWHIQESYRLSGAMHLLALSGLHVGFIYGMLAAALTFLPRTRGWSIVKSSAIILLLGFYAIFSGASPSICRAVLMASIYEAGGVLGREKHGLNSLSLSAMIICCIDPDAPLSISFQLSYSAMLGIFLVQPALQMAIGTVTGSRVVKKVWSVATLSISCQLFTAPLTLHYFGSFPLVSLLTNLLTAPAIAAVMSLAPAAIILGEIPYLGEWSATLLTCAIQGLNLLVEILSRII